MCFAPGLKPRHLCPPTTLARAMPGRNGFCTQIGNDWFTWFGTRPSKSPVGTFSICFVLVIRITC